MTAGIAVIVCAGAIAIADPAGWLTPGAAEADASRYAAVALEVYRAPEVPVQGTLVVVEAMEIAVDGVNAPPGPLTLTGELAGEPLHFEVATDRYRAVAGIPISADRSIELRVAALRDGRPVADTGVAVPVVAGEYRHERLRVAPEFGTRPDSALAARIAAESARAREVSRGAHGTPRLWAEPFVRPRESRITSGFGHGREFNGEIHSRHMGVDFAGAVGAPVVAANRGRVALVADFYLAGTAIYLDHGAGLVTGYFHLSRAAVTEGEVVERGQVIGAVGASGRVTGPHLHWIARYGTVTVNPLGLLELHDRFGPAATAADTAAAAATAH